MDLLRSASYGALVAITFTVGAAFQLGMTLIGVVVAVLSPAVFKMNNAPASSPGQAIGV